MNNLISPTRFLFLAIAIALLMTGCGRGVKQAVDQSVDYQSARSLPPLKLPEPSAAQGVTPAVTFELVQVRGDRARLASTQNQGVNAVWNALKENAPEVGLTVFSRDEQRKALFFGCEDNTQSSASQGRGGWFIFGRDEVKSAAHCALEVVEVSEGVQVRVINRDGREMNAQSAQTVLSRFAN